MAFSIRSQRVEQKARAYAAQEGTTLTGALERALDAVLVKPTALDQAAFEEWYKPIRRAQEEFARLPKTGMTEQEIMGWDENGLPT
jgi:hypothetical protein